MNINFDGVSQLKFSFRRKTEDPRVAILETEAAVVNAVEPPDESVVISADMDTMTSALEEIVAYLLANPSDFNPDRTFNCICKYYSRFPRILYSKFCQMIYVFEDDDQETIQGVLANTEKLNAFAIKQTTFSAYTSMFRKEVVEKAQKATFKIIDFLGLAVNQKQEWVKNDELLSKQAKAAILNESKTLTSQLITMVSIFTALSFLVNGGLALTEIITVNLDVPLSKLLCIVFGGGLVFTNIIFVFLFCISKMTNLSFKSSKRRDANFFQRYPVVCWVNYLLSFLFLSALFGYYFTLHQTFRVVGQKPLVLPGIGLVIGLIVCVVIYFFAGKKLIRLSKDEDPRNKNGDVIVDINEI